MIGEKLKKYGLDVAKRNLSEKENYDWVNVTVGWMEGCGKTDLGVQICKYVDPDYNEENMVVNPKDFIPKVKELPRGSAIHIIEGADVFFAQESSKKIVIKNVKFLTKCRHPYHKFIQIDIPNFFLLTWYVRAHRTRSLIRIIKRGWFWSYNIERMKEIIQDQRTKRIYWGKPSFKDGWTRCTGELRKLYEAAERLKAEEAERSDIEEEKKEKQITKKEAIMKALEINPNLTTIELAKMFNTTQRYIREIKQEVRVK